MGVCKTLAAVMGVSVFVSCSTLTMGDVKNLIIDLPRHDSFQYINTGTLPDRYFEDAYGTLEDPFVYIVLSDTGSPASKVISLFTRSGYNHVSLAFDADLATLISYNGGSGASRPGMNREWIENFHQKTDASFSVYRLEAGRLQKETMIRRIARINQEGSSYNLLGLITKRSYRSNIMFCSQFVYSLLVETDLNYFDKADAAVKPMDFIELDFGQVMTLL